MTLDAGLLKVLAFLYRPTLLVDRHEQGREISREELRGGRVNSMVGLVMMHWRLDIL